MNAVFVDTGGWMACADRRDPAHAACTAARDAALEAGRILITSDFVVDEAWWQQIDGSTGLRWELRLTTVITTDGHFRQVGFDVLPATRPGRTRKPRRA